jgi:hypothetical protein
VIKVIGSYRIPSTSPRPRWGQKTTVVLRFINERDRVVFSRIAGEV